MPGATVCYWHGAAAPQVQRSAAVRLAALVDPAIATLAHATSLRARRKHLSTAVRAADSVLDRTGHPRSSDVDVRAGPLISIEEAASMTDAELAVARRLIERWRSQGRDKLDPGTS